MYGYFIVLIDHVPSEGETMASILIADRDQTERIGIRWFIQSNHIHFDSINETSRLDETIEYIKMYKPEVVCLELEMIPSDRMAETAFLLRHYVQKTICLTAEPVYERALQAIQFHCISLLVKPLSQEQLKKVLFQISKKNSLKIREDAVLPAPNLLYSDFFISRPLKEQTYSLLVLRPEKREQIPTLYNWIDQYSLPHLIEHFALHHDVVCVLQVSKEKEHMTLQQEGRRILQRWISSHPNCRLSLAIHPSSVPAASVHDMYLKTIDMFKLSFFKGLQQLFWMNEDVSFYPIDPFLTPEEQREWLTLLEEGNKHSVKEWLYNHFTGFQNPYPDPELIRVRFTSILAQLRRFMKTYRLDRVNETETHYHEIFKTILSAPVLFSIVQEVVLFIFDLMDGAAKQREMSATNVIERGLQYIEQNYQWPHLKLQDVAEHVGMSSSYYSHLLVKTTGKSFRQTLKNVRLKQAKKLLEETTLPIQEITEIVGFTDANYFSRTFKETTGKSPRTYRQKQSKNSKEK